MTPTARRAGPEDVSELVRLYRLLEKEQTAIKPMWSLADGLPEPVEESLARLTTAADSIVVVGEIDSVPLGFSWARHEDLLPQAEGSTVGSIRLIYTEDDARGVGVGHEMVTLAMDWLRNQGVRLFDAYVSPGHRLAKNFFEAHGFSARLIVMHHDDSDD